MVYPGGKNGAGVYQQLICMMPPHHTYVEPFLGSGAVMRYKLPARCSIGIDADAAAVSSFRDRASSQTAGGAGKLKLIHGDGIEFLKSYPWRGGELVYCDPPYIISARRQSRPIYRCELTDEQHRALLRTLQLIPRSVMVMVSGYHSEMYAKALACWRCETFEAMTRGGKKALEHVWLNFPEPLELHDYRYLGQGYRERERIKKKKNRWLRMLGEMPALERHAIMSAIAELRSTYDGRGDGGHPRDLNAVSGDA